MKKNSAKDERLVSDYITGKIKLRDYATRLLRSIVTADMYEWQLEKSLRIASHNFGAFGTITLGLTWESAFT